MWMVGLGSVGCGARTFVADEELLHPIHCTLSVSKEARPNAVTISSKSNTLFTHMIFLLRRNLWICLLLRNSVVEMVLRDFSVFLLGFCWFLVAVTAVAAAAAACQPSHDTQYVLFFSLSRGCCLWKTPNRSEWNSRGDWIHIGKFVHKKCILCMGWCGVYNALPSWSMLLSRESEHTTNLRRFVCVAAKKREKEKKQTDDGAAHIGLLKTQAHTHTITHIGVRVRSTLLHSHTYVVAEDVVWSRHYYCKVFAHRLKLLEIVRVRLWIHTNTEAHARAAQPIRFVRICVQRTQAKYIEHNSYFIASRKSFRAEMGKNIVRILRCFVAVQLATVLCQSDAYWRTHTRRHARTHACINVGSAWWTWTWKINSQKLWKKNRRRILREHGAHGVRLRSWCVVFYDSFDAMSASYGCLYTFAVLMVAAPSST